MVAQNPYRDFGEAGSKFVNGRGPGGILRGCDSVEDESGDDPDVFAIYFRSQRADGAFSGREKQNQSNGQSKMKKLPRASWKFWKRAPASLRRRVHLGIDYGSSTSKIVFRDYDAPGGESAVLVHRNGSIRIPSRVCMSATELLFGDDGKTPANCALYESIKMRVAAEVGENPNYSLGPTTTLPDGFSAADLAALTVWFLISEGQRAVAAHFNGRMEGVELSMTMGVPMTFFNDKQIKASFLSIAQRAWSFFCDEGLLESALLTEKARQVLEKHPVATNAIADDADQDWVRCEGEASIWWAMHSPGAGIGPYAMVDIGASTTQANLFRMFGKVQTPKRSLVPYGAATAPVGMDEVGRAAAKCEGLSSDWLSLRGLEQSVQRENAKGREALTRVCEQIYEAYRKAWMEASSKLEGNAIEFSAWRQHKLFLMGGGSLTPLLVDTIRIHPDLREPLSVMTLEQPIDLIRADHRKLTSEELPFAAVAYGLSSMEAALPNPYCRDPG